MLVSTVIIAALGLLTSPVNAGSRHWEASALLVGRSNSTNGLKRRAISFQPSGGEGGTRVWPGKKIKYCYADAEAERHLRGPLEEAMRTTWGQLIENGFSYERVDLAVCEADRKNHLKIFYNDRGRLVTTIAVPAVDEEWNRQNPDRPFVGPEMHLSTLDTIGMLDVVANVAHELGHAWGLYHEHQNPKLWVTGFDDQFPSDPNRPPWLRYNGANAVFRPSQFDCTALSDYQDALTRAQELAQQNPGLYSDIHRTMCSSQSNAAKVKFSAADWLPLGPGTPFIGDDTFDPDSIMLYPSGAGGRRPGNGPDGRQNVMILENNQLITPNVSPSTQDIQRLLTLYETNAVDIQPLLSQGPKRSTFGKLKDKITGHGSAKNKKCL